MKARPPSEEAVKKLIEAGRIASRVREAVKKYVREGMPIIDVCEFVESSIRERGGEPAFPCNVSINEVAAHSTSPPGDVRTIPEGSVVKVDIGVHVDGYVVDTAVTTCFNADWEPLVLAAEEALKEAVKLLRPGVSSSELGFRIQRAIESKGLKPVSNLTGHQVGRYLIHAGKALPNVAHSFGFKIELGEVYAVEPFVTTADAVGKVKTGREVTIFRFQRRKPLKGVDERELLDYIERRFRTLPFAERWLLNAMPKGRYEEAFRKLLSSKCLFSYPIFVEASGKRVAQAEHTVLIVENGCLILTE